MTLLKLLKRTFLFPIAFLLTVIIFILSLVVLTLLIVPTYFYRYFVILISKCIYPGSKILSGLDNIMAKGNIYLQSDLYVSLQLSWTEQFVYEEFLENWDSRVMKKIRPEGNGNETMFPELSHYISTLLGYSFYRLDKTFNLKNHIKLYEDPNPNSFVDRRKLDKIRMDFVKTIFKKEKSPWEILLVNNYRHSDTAEEDEEKGFSVMIFKCHHCLADGYSTLLLFWETLIGQRLDAINPPKFSSLKINWKKRVGALALSFYHYVIADGTRIFNCLYSWDKLGDKNSWHDNKHPTDMITTSVRPISTKTVKEISSENKISITATLIAICTGGFRRMMTAKGRVAPKTIRTALSVVLPNHPRRLTNHSFVSDFDIPIDNLDETKRLKNTDRNLSNNVRSSLAISAPLAQRLLFPLPVSWEITTKIPSTDSMFFSTVRLPPSVPESGVELANGCKLFETYSYVHFSAIQNHCATIQILKYRDEFFINFGIQKYLLTSEDEIYDFEKYILDELYHLKNLTSV